MDTKPVYVVFDDGEAMTFTRIAENHRPVNEFESLDTARSAIVMDESAYRNESNYPWMSRDEKDEILAMDVNDILTTKYGSYTIVDMTSYREIIDAVETIREAGSLIECLLDDVNDVPEYLQLMARNAISFWLPSSVDC